jgi:hypothetical protein
MIKAIGTTEPRPEPHATTEEPNWFAESMKKHGYGLVCVDRTASLNELLAKLEYKVEVSAPSYVRWYDQQMRASYGFQCLTLKKVGPLEPSVSQK